jgi:DNA polymerase (family X)
MIARLDAASLDREQVAASLRQAAELLHAQGANPFRVSAYRKAADAVLAYAGDLRALFERKGLPGLDELPGVGAGIAAAIGEMLRTGRWSQLERLRGSLDPTRLFQTGRAVLLRRRARRGPADGRH